MKNKERHRAIKEARNSHRIEGGRLLAKSREKGKRMKRTDASLTGAEGKKRGISLKTDVCLDPRRSLRQRKGLKGRHAGKAVPAGGKTHTPGTEEKKHRSQES